MCKDYPKVETVVCVQLTEFLNYNGPLALWPALNNTNTPVSGCRPQNSFFTTFSLEFFTLRKQSESLRPSAEKHLDNLKYDIREKVAFVF